ncbi:MAG: hypothetical protein Q7S27_02705 [Nanoarchaeota archaeon]|nr:hypothetical protein [Nanoarchaeota archaeon]
MKNEIEQYPFNQKELETMIGSEFYVMFYNRGQAGRKNAGDISILGKRQISYFYIKMLGELRTISLEEGELPIPKNIFDHYIFTLENLTLSQKIPPILEGAIVRYDPESNTTNPGSKRKVILQMDKIPAKISKEIGLCILSK